MSLSACPKCWDDMCCCGYKYREYWSVERIKDLIEVLNKVVKEKEADEVKNNTKS